MAAADSSRLHSEDPGGSRGLNAADSAAFQPGDREVKNRRTASADDQTTKQCSRTPPTSGNRVCK